MNKGKKGDWISLLRSIMGRTSTYYYLINYAIAILYSLAIILPLYYLFVSSFKDNTQIYGNPMGLPTSWDLSNFFRAEEIAHIFRAMVFTALIVGCAEILLIVIGFPASYALARIRVPFAGLTEALFGSGFLIPEFAVLLPVFLMAVSAGLLYNPLSVILFYLAARLPLTVIMLASQMREIPLELEESAIIDGANRLQIICHVIFPLTRSALATVAILNFIFMWNEYLFALILLSDETRTIQVAIPLLRSEHVVDYGKIAAGVMMSLVPVYIVFIFFQERIIKGMLGGAMKG